VSVTGTIHDLGYKRYLGTRRPPSTRWQVIARHQIASGWKGWWRFKPALAIAVVTTIVAAVVIFFVDKTLSGMPGGRTLAFSDYALPIAVNWCNKAAFILSLTVSASVIAGDMQSGAFTFYFARSTRPIDYLLGKLVGLGALVGILCFVFPVIVAGLRLGLSESVDQLLDRIWLLPKMAFVGLVATVAYTTIPLGFSALMPNRRYALGLWAAYYIVGGFMFIGMGIKGSSWIAALDINEAVSQLGNHLFDIQLPGNRAHIPIAAHTA